MQVQIGLRGVVTTILPALVTWASANCSSNEVFIGAILKPLGRNDYKAIRPILTPPLRLSFSSTASSLADDLCQSVLVYRSPLRKLDTSSNQLRASFE